MTIDTDILKILEAEQLTPSENVESMCAKIKARHPERVQAFLYYGSSLRAMNDPDKMLDFYVLVDSYWKTHKNPVRAILNALIPPAVYYLENENANGSVSTCKYSIISLRAFESKSTKRALLSVIWGRFSQPCVLLFPKTNDIKQRVQNARTSAIKHIASLTSPLVSSPVDTPTFWSRAFFESYNTELRPEKSDGRTREIVNRYQGRYEGLSNALFGKPNEHGEYQLPAHTKIQKFMCKSSWVWRRIIGKPMAAIRVLNSAFTFAGGADYAVHKIKSHSGVTIALSPSQRKHPVLWSPVLAWKVFKSGALKK